jgi:hypothetical protein
LIEHSTIFDGRKKKLEKEVKERLDFEKEKKHQVKSCKELKDKGTCQKGLKCSFDHYRTAIGVCPDVSTVVSQLMEPDTSNAVYPKFGNLECQGTEKQKIACRDNNGYCCFHSLDVTTQLSAVYSQYEVTQCLENCDVTALCGIARNCCVFDEEFRKPCEDNIAPSRNFISHDHVNWDDSKRPQPKTCFDGTHSLLQLYAPERLRDFTRFVILFYRKYRHHMTKHLFALSGFESIARRTYRLETQLRILTGRRRKSRS